MVRCLFIHLKFRHLSLDGSTFVAQAPQFPWTTQFPNGHCTARVHTRKGATNYSVFVGKRDSSHWNSSRNSSSLWLKCDDQAIQITWWCQAWGANMAAWSGSHLPSTGFWEMDVVPRQMPQRRRWLSGKISEVKCNKWIKRHLTMWSYLVAIK